MTRLGPKFIAVALCVALFMLAAPFAATPSSMLPGYIAFMPSAGTFYQPLDITVAAGQDLAFGRPEANFSFANAAQKDTGMVVNPAAVDTYILFKASGVVRLVSLVDRITPAAPTCCLTSIQARAPCEVNVATNHKVEARA